jgi:SAM-dependent methyltransferase
MTTDAANRTRTSRAEVSDSTTQGANHVATEAHPITVMNPPNIQYRPLSEFPGWALGPAFLASLVDTYHPRVILEIGSGANPTLDITKVESAQVRYITSDLSAVELDKAPVGYESRQIDMEATIPNDLRGVCDMVFSRMVNEHIHDGRRYHTNIKDILAPGGVAIHCFSTLYALPFVVNKLLPESLSSRLLKTVAPRDEHKLGKFRAYYSWSRGPTKRMVKRYQDIGYEVIAYNGFFGHTYYARRLPSLDRLEQLKAGLLVKHPNPHLCAFATVILRKPLGGLLLS